MTGLTITGALTVRGMPKAMFADRAAVREFSTERREYEAAVSAFAAEAAARTIRRTIALARRHGIQMTAAEVRANAAAALRQRLEALSYDSEEIEWHAARRGRRERHLFASGLPALRSVIKESPQAGKWHGFYKNRRQ
jgi:hypothetical protein